MRPQGVIPTRGAVAAVALHRRRQAALGAFVPCDVCGRACSGRLSLTMVASGCTRDRVGFTAGKVCSGTCAELLRARAARPA